MKEINVEIKEVKWEHAEAVCNARLIELGYETFLPFSGGGEIDLIAVKDGVPVRIQIKSKSPTSKEKIKVHLTRNVVNYKKHITKPYFNIDWFMIYDGTNIYKIDNSHVKSHVCFRYKFTKNKQKVGVKMAFDYIF